MINVILSGCSGDMGKVLIESIKNDNAIKIVAGICNTTDIYFNFPVYNCFSHIRESADIIIDFSSKYLLDDLLEYADRHNLGLVIATTGYSNYDEEKIYAMSRKVPVFRSANMSYGVNSLLRILEYAVTLLKNNYDIEIVESHSGKKIDAPSGTAKMMLNTIKQNVPYKTNVVFEREGVLNGRKNSDIGVHSIRGGNILGEHTVIFAGEGDIIKLEHIALSKKIYADGAIKAAKFISTKKKGYYNINDLVFLDKENNI